MSVFNFQAFSGCMVVPSEQIVRTGVLTFDDALMSSSNLGRPSVTFLALFPALWKVLSVICVVGSPTDCAAMVPTISPAATMLACHFFKRRLQMSVNTGAEQGKSFLAKMAKIYACTSGTCKVALSNGAIVACNSDSVRQPLSLNLCKSRAAGTEMAHFSPSFVV